jgi:hypothetical protein
MLRRGVDIRYVVTSLQ